MSPSSKAKQGSSSLRRSRRIATAAAQQPPRTTSVLTDKLPPSAIAATKLHGNAKRGRDTTTTLDSSSSNHHLQQTTHESSSKKVARRSRTRVTPSPRKSAFNSAANATPLEISTKKDESSSRLSNTTSDEQSQERRDAATAKQCNDVVPSNVYDLDERVHIEELMRGMCALPDVQGASVSDAVDSDGSAFLSTTGFLTTYGMNYYNSLRMVECMYHKNSACVDVNNETKTNTKPEAVRSSTPMKKQPKEGSPLGLKRKDDNDNAMQIDVKTPPISSAQDKENQKPASSPDDAEHSTDGSVCSPMPFVFCQPPSTSDGNSDGDGGSISSISIASSHASSDFMELSPSPVKQRGVGASTAANFLTEERNNNNNSTIIAETYPYPAHKSLTNRMRVILIDWLVEVCEECRLSSSILAASVQLVDRVLNLLPKDADIVDGVGRLKREMVQCVGW
jgi:hypothetical protein